jgi:hypothetical protein
LRPGLEPRYLLAVTALLIGCGGKTFKASDPEVVSKAEQQVEVRTRETLELEPAGQYFSVQRVSCKPLSDRQLDCTAVLAGPSGSGEAPRVGWRATVAADSGEITLRQKSAG